MYNVCTNIESVYCLVNMSNVVQISSIDALFMLCLGTSAGTVGSSR